MMSLVRIRERKNSSCFLYVFVSIITEFSSTLGSIIKIIICFTLLNKSEDSIVEAGDGKGARDTNQRRPGTTRGGASEGSGGGARPRDAQARR